MPEGIMDVKEIWEPVPLEPYVHQVGGTSSVLKFDDTTLCKPLIARENHFYKTMPSAMKEFTPGYRGAIEVAFHEDSKGYLTLIGYPPGCHDKVRLWREAQESSGSCGEGEDQSDEEEEVDSETRRLPMQQSKGNGKEALRVRMRRTGSIDFEGDVEVLDNTDQLVEHAGHNPWSLRCHKRTLSKMWKNISPSGTFKFILLENVSSEFKYPCILDLKMGTRQYGDEENETKRKRKIDKCAATTSASLAIRLAGMQVYQVNSLSFVCRNKYYGRGLTVEGFKETLYQFLHNGHKLRVDIIDPMIERLLQFHEMLSKQDTFRFYSSSLLLMYDGKEHTSDMKKNTPVREMAPKRSRSLDDSSFITPGSSSGSEDSNEDQLLLLPSSCSAEHHTLSKINAEKPKSLSKENISNKCKGEPRSKHPRPPKVDVRMIDFAHTTHEGFTEDNTVHRGPDKGYLKGLENLIKLFEEIKTQYTR